MGPSWHFTVLMMGPIYHLLVGICAMVWYVSFISRYTYVQMDIPLHIYHIAVISTVKCDNGSTIALYSTGKCNGGLIIALNSTNNCNVVYVVSELTQCPPPTEIPNCIKCSKLFPHIILFN